MQDKFIPFFLLKFCKFRLGICHRTLVGKGWKRERGWSNFRKEVLNSESTLQQHGLNEPFSPPSQRWRSSPHHVLRGAARGCPVTRPVPGDTARWSAAVIRHPRTERKVRRWLTAATMHLKAEDPITLLLTQEQRFAKATEVSSKSNKLSANICIT